MRIIGKLAAAAGVTAVFLLASPAANAATPVDQAVTTKAGGLPIVGSLPIVSQVLNGILGGKVPGGTGSMGNLGG